MSWRLANASLPEHAVCCFADGDLGRLHSLANKFSKEPDRPRGSLLTWGVHYPVEIEVVEFLLYDFELFLFGGQLSFCRSLRGLFDPDFLFCLL